MTAPCGYSLSKYGWMVEQPVRSDAYVEALRRAIQPGDLVFDIGAGPGIFAIFACRLGAARAVAIESDPSVLLAPALARAAGVADRVDLFNGISTDFRPEERADVIVSDLRGSSPLFERHIPSLIDARERLLKPDGTMIPASDRIWAALVESDDAYQEIDRPWSANRFGLDLAPARPFVFNAVHSRRFAESEQLSAPARLAEIDYRTVTQADFDMPFVLEACRDGTVHGLVLWFDSDLYDGVGFATSPADPPTVYGMMFLPIERPASVRTGDRVTGEILARLDDAAYVWSWRLRFGGEGAGATECRHTTGLSGAFAAPGSARAAPGRVPVVDPAVALDRFILNQIDGTRTIEAIANLALAQFPDRLPDAKAALTHVADLAARYDRS